MTDEKNDEALENLSDESREELDKGVEATKQEQEETHKTETTADVLGLDLEEDDEE